MKKVLSERDRNSMMYRGLSNMTIEELKGRWKESAKSCLKLAVELAVIWFFIVILSSFVTTKDKAVATGVDLFYVFGGMLTVCFIYIAYLRDMIRMVENERLNE